ncbi:MAG: hypothetical protein SPLUMA1_SPLUMAMAG1_00479 [uncultured Sulfurimonas sp.]|nr:MAG: hypothetical protein SPLUMA1_SPLUMAMAG1_00479 [uncultured Sulfurimonas sp.]
MENISDTFVIVIIATVTLIVANMHLRIKSLEKKLGK